ncbi:unnamed protein product [Sphagnum troendelagicum]|uniref:Uncharacterized protein n=1 Tax=Sphagnum troendelagicum TaxID=128251 RepID=A0ABP0U867_9BRYO
MGCDSAECHSVSQTIAGTRVASDSSQGLTDFTSMIKKVQQLQEDVQNTVTTSRVLSRHLEKLGEQQAKQLALISAGIGKMLKEQQKFEERIAKELSGKQIKGDGEALRHVATCGSHPANGAPQKLSKSVTMNSNQFSDQSFSKVDFWGELWCNL